MQHVLHLGGLTVIGWDSLKDQFHGRNASSPLWLRVADASEAQQVFAVLATLGTVMAPFDRYAASTPFGTVMDEFGVLWAVAGAAPCRVARDGAASVPRLFMASASLDGQGIDASDAFMGAMAATVT